MAWVIYQGLMTSWGKLIGPGIKQKGTYHFIRDLFVINYIQNICCFDILQHGCYRKWKWSHCRTRMFLYAVVQQIIFQELYA